MSLPDILNGWELRHPDCHDLFELFQIDGRVLDVFSLHKKLLETDLVLPTHLGDPLPLLELRVNYPALPQDRIFLSIGALPKGEVPAPGACGGLPRSQPLF